jgi:hypothetical protein
MRNPSRYCVRKVYEGQREREKGVIEFIISGGSTDTHVYARNVEF